MLHLTRLVGPLLFGFGRKDECFQFFDRFPPQQFFISFPLHLEETEITPQPLTESHFVRLACARGSAKKRR
jgi:hypothetical protein